MLILLFLYFSVYGQLIYENQLIVDDRKVENETYCIKIIQDSMSKELLYQEMLIQAFQQQWYQCLNQSINYYNDNAIDLYKSFQLIKTSINNVNNTLFELMTLKLPEASATLNIIEPCYLWAQNMTHLLLKIKFSSKIDVPGAQLINKLSIIIKPSYLYIEAYSFELLNRYILRIQTYKLMNPNYYSYQFVELGQITLQILKSPSPYFWKNIHSNVMYNPSNQYIWWDMYYQYRQQLEVAFGLLEDTENKREENERQIMKDEEETLKSKRNLKKMKIKNNELQLQLFCRFCIPLDGDEWNSWQL